MRKIEQETIAAVRRGESWRKGNMEVWAGEGTLRVKLHGNTIAVRRDGQWAFTLAGWPTPTTRSRINALARAFRPGLHVNQSGGNQIVTEGCFRAIVGDEEWF